jgi:hypothetical protein
LGEWLFDPPIGRYASLLSFQNEAIASREGKGGLCFKCVYYHGIEVVHIFLYNIMTGVLLMLRLKGVA